MVSMINFSAGFDPYKDYTSVLKRSAHIKTEETENPKVEEPVTSISEEKSAEASKSAVMALQEQLPVADISDVSESLKGIQDFSFIGRESDIRLLDTNKAVSDMKKDDVLSEYQYFVGSAEKLYNNDDGLVLQKIQ